MKFSLMALCALLLCTSQAAAQFDLQITEIWPGNEVGDDLTSDWFEVTNYGVTDFNFGADGTLYFDDDSMDGSTADEMFGVTTIAAGESVIFVDDDTNAEFLSVWGVGGVVQVGTYAGSGLSGGGDGVTLFNSADATVTTDEIIDFEAYPGDGFGASYDVDLATFSTVGNASGAFATAPNADGESAIGSPGSVAAIPEPATTTLLCFATLGLIARRRG